MSSVISTLNQSWINYNTLGGAEKADKKEQKYFDYIKTMGRDKNYFELKSKLNFTLNGLDYSIIKFYFHSQELARPQSGSYVMQKKGNRWYLTSNTNTTSIALMTMRFQEAKYLVLLQANLTGDKLMDDLIKRVTPNGALDFTLLYKEFSSWYTNNDSQKIEYFIDKNSW